jgi:menaquinone-9 beta-reductase
VIGQKEEVDVFVISAGPAGLAAAIAAKRKGFRAMIADGAAPPVDKPCGEGLLPETQAVLSELGVDLPASDGCFFRGIRFVSGSAELAGDFPKGQGIGICRPVLRMIQGGVSLLWKTLVRGVGTDGVQLSGGTVSARWIVAADGCGLRVRRWSGLDEPIHHEARTAVRRHHRARPWSDYVEVYWGQRSPSYVSPVSRDEICIVVVAEQAEEADFERALADMPKHREYLADAKVSGRERGAITAMRTLRHVEKGLEIGGWGPALRFGRALLSRRGGVPAASLAGCSAGGRARSLPQPV